MFTVTDITHPVKDALCGRCGEKIRVGERYVSPILTKEIRWADGSIREPAYETYTHPICPTLIPHGDPNRA